MPTWVPVHTTLFTHPKTIAAARELRCDKHKLVGHLAELWCWAITNRDDGSLAGLEARDIARAAGWLGGAARFVQVLISAGFLDANLGIHDWDAYLGLLIDRRRADAERKRRERAGRRGLPGARGVAQQSVDLTGQRGASSPGASRGPSAGRPPAPDPIRPNSPGQRGRSAAISTRPEQRTVSHLENTAEPLATSGHPTEPLAGQASDDAGQEAYKLVDVYVEQRRHKFGDGARFTDDTSLGILGSHAKRLMTRGAPPDLLRRAVREYGATEGANPAFLVRWLAQVEIGAEIAAHMRRKAEEPRDGGLTRIATLLRGAGAAGGDARDPRDAISSAPADWRAEDAAERGAGAPW